MYQTHQKHLDTVKKKKGLDLDGDFAFLCNTRKNDGNT